MRPPLRGALWTAAALGLLHGAVALLGALEPATNAVLFAADLYVAFCGWLVLRDGGRRALALFAVGYLVLFLLVVGVLERESLFVLLAIAYASVFRLKWLLGAFALFVLCYVVLQPYAFESFVPLLGAWAALWAARRAGAPPFAVACLGVGLVAVGALLLPLLHLVIQDSPQTLWHTFARPGVQRALWLSLASSGLATLLVAVWGIPLAWALVRTRLRGRAAIETLIDLPILVPQSVVGIALLVLLGPGSPLGAGLEAIGLGVAGRFAGIVLAQAFVASPFLIKTAMTAFEGVPEHLEDASRTLGVPPWRTFLRVSLPLAARGVAVGLILCWARAISEFGAIVLFAPHPLTGPVLVHDEFLRAGTSESRPVAVLLLLVCLWVFALLQFGRAWLPGMGARREARR